MSEQNKSRRPGFKLGMPRVVGKLRIPYAIKPELQNKNGINWSFRNKREYSMTYDLDKYTRFANTYHFQLQETWE